jgi:hypothetical protein
MLERDRNRDGILDPDEIEKAGPANFHTPDRHHSATLSRRNWDKLRLTQYFPGRSCADGLGVCSSMRRSEVRKRENLCPSEPYRF